MMLMENINWLGIVVCVVLSMVIGFVWYNPRVFFTTWWNEVGRGEEMTGDMSPVIWVLTILAAFVEAFFVNVLLNTMNSTTLASGLTAGFLIWLGFVATTNLVNNLFAGHSWKIWAIESGQHLVFLLVSGAILSVWR